MTGQTGAESVAQLQQAVSDLRNHDVRNACTVLEQEIKILIKLVSDPNVNLRGASKQTDAGKLATMKAEYQAKLERLVALRAAID